MKDDDSLCCWWQPMYTGYWLMTSLMVQLVGALIVCYHLLDVGIALDLTGRAI